MRTIIVTGGAGFIGSAVVREILNSSSDNVIVVDKLTYAGTLTSLSAVKENPRFHFEKKDICDRKGIEDVFRKFKPDIIMHLAAESHVDRSIDGPSEFMSTNIIGTFNLLEIALEYWKESGRRREFLFHHVSTDEVYGDLADTGGLFTEESRYEPSSPYSASKASADHLVRAWMRTYGLPTVVTNCSNNYGPFHFPEKLIPLMIINACSGKSLPVYGAGNQVRDWLYVEDHARALYKVATSKSAGMTYNIGGNSERSNLEVVLNICSLLEDLLPVKPNGIKKYEDLIKHVVDRPGHDMRYAIDASKIRKDLGWVPNETFESGLYKTVHWYLENATWWQSILDKSYLQRREL